MDGPEHFAEGERLLALAEGTEGPVVADAAVVLLRRADLHFQAALIAATIECANRRLSNEEWYEAIHHKPPHLIRKPDGSLGPVGK